MIARKPATPNSWKRLPAPSMIENLGFSAQFQAEDAEALQRGLVPDGMEDKWFIYFESGWLCFHRSWTGAFIYAMQLEDHDGAVRVASSWVNRDPAQYNATDTAYDRKFVAFLIDAFLLGKTGLTFPLPNKAAATAPGAVQHSLIGRGFPEPKSG